MKKFKLFIENFVIYGFGGIINKLIPLIMLPIVTRMMPDSSCFGLSDLTTTIVSLTSSLAIMGMYDAMYRMFFEKENDMLYKKTICSTALACTFFSSFIVFLIMLVFGKLISYFVYGNASYTYLITIAALTTYVGATNQIIASPTRMQNKRKIYLCINVLSSVLLYLVAMILLKYRKYVVALPIATLISVLCIEIIFIIINRKWFSMKLFDICLLKKMLVIAIPLMPSFIIYWIFNASDRIMITNIMGIGAAGIYAIGSKLGHASQLIYTAFAGGWQYFAYSTMKDNNQVKSNSLVFEYLGILSYVATTFICAWSYSIYKIMFTAEYIEGYIVAPYLFLAPLLQMLFQVAASQFVILKRTWPNMIILTSGAILNVILNFSLIPVLGIEGAAIASLIGYLLSDIIGVIVLVKLNMMIISRRFIVASSAMAVFMVLWRQFFSNNTLSGTFCAISYVFIVVLLYKNDFIKLMNDERERCHDNAE